MDDKWGGHEIGCPYLYDPVNLICNCPASETPTPKGALDGSQVKAIPMWVLDGSQVKSPPKGALDGSQVKKYTILANMNMYDVYASSHKKAARLWIDECFWERHVPCWSPKNNPFKIYIKDGEGREVDYYVSFKITVCIIPPKGVHLTEVI